jgi:hypothetical protein
MRPHLTNADFARLSWHDDTLYGLRLEVGDRTHGDWRSELVLDVDHIVEWVCGADRSARFRVAPATLVFHDVTDLRVALDWGDSGHQIALTEPQIDRITRALVRDQKICLDRPYYRWRIAFNWLPGGELGFGASGVGQTLRAAPVLLDQQRLPPANRTPLP